jgi:hypothetical protein
MGIHLGRKDAKPAPSKTGFAGIPGHRHLVDRDAIKKSKNDRIVEAVGKQIQDLHAVVSEARLKQTL